MWQGRLGLAAPSRNGRGAALSPCRYPVAAQSRARLFCWDSGHVGDAPQMLIAPRPLAEYNDKKTRRAENRPPRDTGNI